MNFLAPEKRTYLFQTLDPLHVGTGGTRLGRVDNTVVRDPATRLPKVPGSGLSGAVKDAYDLKTLVDKNGRPKLQRCAGSNGCGDSNCKVCILFGTAPSDEMGGGSSTAKRGMIAFRDATLVAMPVATLTGPAWIMEEEFALEMKLIAQAGLKGLPGDPDVAASENLKVLSGKVNVGSFVFPVPKMGGVTIPTNGQEGVTFFGNGSHAKAYRMILERGVVCHSTVFPLLVDTAMEVRTSVTIDPETGAAEPQKLFTLEAVPAGALFKVVLDFLGGIKPDLFNDSNAIFKDIEDKGFPYLSLTGLGGNVTRGFGRVRFLGHL